MNVTIIGSGIYATSIASILECAHIRMWTEREKLDVIVPEGIILTHSYDEALKDSDLIFIFTGSKYVPDILENIKDLTKNNIPIIIGSKGILENGIFLSDLVQEKFPNNPVAFLSGPTFAIDVAHKDPIGLTLASQDKSVFDMISSIMPDAYLEYSSDIKAVELCGCIKNAYAIGSGIISGLDFGPSTTALFITRAISEIKTILSSFSMDNSVIESLSCFGDMMLTCTSPNSRNFTFGTMLSLENKESRQEYLNRNTVEGYDNLKAFVYLFKTRHIDAPILESIYNIITRNLDTYNLIEIIKK